MLITVCITNHNYEQFVERAIETVLAQDHDEVEAIVVDDGSTDGSLGVLERYRHRITVVPKVNGGQASAMNAGFSASRGEVLVFLDADDELMPGALSSIARIFDARPATAKVALRMRKIDAEGNDLGALEPAEGWPLPVGDLSKHVLECRTYLWPASSGNAYGRSALADIMPIPEEDFRVEADLYLATLIPLCGPVAAIEEPLVLYRIHGSNIYADGDRDASFFRRKLERIEAIHEIVGEWQVANDSGPVVAVDRVRDPAYHSYRLSSMLLDPARHPHPADSWRSLALRGAYLAARVPGHPARARIRRSLWFLAVGLAPRPEAQRLVDARFR